MSSGNVFTNIPCSLASGFYYASDYLLAWINHQNYIHKTFPALVVGRFSFANIKESLLKLCSSAVFVKRDSYVHIPYQDWAHCGRAGSGSVKWQSTSVLCRWRQPCHIHSPEKSELQSRAVWLLLEPILFMGRAGWLVEKVFTMFLMKNESLLSLTWAIIYFFSLPLTHLQHN